MKRRILVALSGGILLIGFSIEPPLHAQTCNDDEAMVKSYVSALTDTVSAVQKESLSDFEKDFHQKTCMTKLGLSLDIVDGLLGCLDKAAKDTTITKEQADAVNTKRQSYGKLKDKLTRDRSELKGAQDSKAAKALIEKFDLSG